MPKAFATITFILLVIGALLFVLVGKIAADFFAITVRTSNSFSELVTKIQTVKDGSQEPQGFFLDTDKNALLGFAPQASRIELINKEYNGFETILTYIERPDTCQKDASCICMCTELLPGQTIGSQSKCTIAKECKSLPSDRTRITSYTFISERASDHVGSSKKLMQSYFWKHGFVILRSEQLPGYFNNIQGIKINQNLKAVYIRNDLGNVGVCATSRCEVLAPGTYN